MFEKRDFLVVDRNFGVERQLYANVILQFFADFGVAERFGFETLARSRPLWRRERKSTAFGPAVG